MRGRIDRRIDRQGGCLFWLSVIVGALAAYVLLHHPPANAQEITVSAIASHSEAAGYDGPVLGVEVIGDLSRLRIEGSLHRIDKFDGGDGFAYRGLVGVHLPSSFIVGVQVAGMNTERYQRTDYWLVAQWAFFRAELERETWRLEARPEFTLWKGLYVRPSVGFSSGRGSSGFVSSLAIGYSW